LETEDLRYMHVGEVGVGGCAETAGAGEAPDRREEFLALGAGLEEVDVCDGDFFAWVDGSGSVGGMD